MLTPPQRIMYAARIDAQLFTSPEIGAINAESPKKKGSRVMMPNNVHNPIAI
jgi:hypothetical protein